jgi:cysteine synthase A
MAQPPQPPHAVTSVLKTGERTPLVRLRAFEREGGPALYAKLEFMGPGGSIFDRAAIADLSSADRAGHLLNGKPLIAAGGTDAAISLALVASALGNPLTLLVPRSLMPERRRALLDYGAKLENLDDDLGFEPAQDQAFERASASGALYVNLFEGETVVDSYAAVAAEVLEALGRSPSLVVCGLDLGAIPSGLSRGLGETPVVAVEPASARIGSGGAWSPHLQLGLAPAPLASALDRSRVTQFEAVSDDDAWRACELLTRRTGILAGIASGAILVGGLRRAEMLGSGDVVVLVLPDSGERRFMLAPFFAG